MRPRVFTFDIFGTVIDWRRGLPHIDDATFDRVIDHQGRAEVAAPTRRYRDIVADSLVEVLGRPRDEAARTGAAVGQWPLFADSAEGLRRLRRIAPCVATTNSDRAHGEDVQAQLGFRLDDWVCAEDVGAYKPSPEVWRFTARKLGQPLDRSWWHVSAYADYDLEVARALGLTCVFIARPHARPGPHDVAAPDLLALAALAEQP
jgi:2-haloalkanoic acid dehalogenase type II